jgi:hypothetical protein
MQVSKALTQDDFEAGNVRLAAAVAAVSGPDSGSMTVKSNASISTELPPAPSMLVTIALVPGEPTSVSAAGGHTGACAAVTPTVLDWHVYALIKMQGGFICASTCMPFLKSGCHNWFLLPLQRGQTCM